jgi:hypothetical protein
MKYDPDKEILGVIKANPTITYGELVYESIASPSMIWDILQTLRKSKKITSVPVIGKKAKGWVIVTT